MDWRYLMTMHISAHDDQYRVWKQSKPHKTTSILQVHEECTGLGWIMKYQHISGTYKFHVFFSRYTLFWLTTLCEYAIKWMGLVFDSNRFWNVIVCLLFTRYFGFLDLDGFLGFDYFDMDWYQIQQVPTAPVHLMTKLHRLVRRPSNSKSIQCPCSYQIILFSLVTTVWLIVLS